MVELIWDKNGSGIATGPSGASITVGEASDFSPEDLMATAVAGCVMRSFLARAAVADVPILSYASASYVEGTRASSARVVLRCYVVIGEDGSTAAVQKLLEAARRDSPVCSLLADSFECRADIRRLCGTCAR